MNGLEQITEMADNLSPSEQLKLVEHLAQRLRKRNLVQKKPRDLYGIWKGKFPEGVELDLLLKEVRDEWKKEMDFDL